MTPRQKRDRLFRSGRPNLRGFELYDGPEYHKDIKILWVAHKRSPLLGLDHSLSESEFINEVVNLSAEIVIIDDTNPQFRAQGPVGAAIIADNGWRFEPHIIFFPWATKKNMLRSVVGGLQWARHSRRIGCVEIRCGEESVNLFNRACQYGVLHYVGRVVCGSPHGDDYIFSVKGKKNVI